MAGIDKTYVASWKEYKELRDWAQNTNMIYPNGVNGGKMIDWFYFPDLSEEDFTDSKEYILWNTSTAVDMFLYKNCSFELVQNRLKEQYGIHITELARNSVNKHEIGNHFKFPKRISRDIYWITVKRDTEDWNYSEEYNMWTEWDEYGPYNTNVCIRRIPSRKALCRLIREWNLPKGAIVNFSGYHTEFNILIRK